MTHSFKLHFFHCIWSTKSRQSLITKDIEAHLYAYIGGIVSHKKGILLEIGGASDHVHLLLNVNTIDNFSALIRDIKASSSAWVHKQFPNLKDFAWQEGYGSFSVSYSSVDKVREYIQNQEEHHKKISFEEEFLKFLECHRVQYDKRFVFG